MHVLLFRLLCLALFIKKWLPSWPHHTKFALTTSIGRIWKTQTLMKHWKLETTQVLLNFYWRGKNSVLNTYVAAMLRCCQGGPCCCCPLHPGRVGNDGHCRLHTPRSHHHCPPPEPHTPPQTLSVLSERDSQNEHFHKNWGTVWRVVLMRASLCYLLGQNSDSLLVFGISQIDAVDSKDGVSHVQTPASVCRLTWMDLRNKNGDTVLLPTLMRTHTS